MVRKTPVGYKISKLMKKGMPHRQAVAVALSMEQKGQLGPRGGYRRAPKKTESRPTNPRAMGTNPRAMGTNPRAVGKKNRTNN